MDSKNTVRNIEKTFTVDSGGDQLLCIAHTLINDGDFCTLDITVTAEDTSGSINKFVAFSGRFLCFRSGGTVSTTTGGFESNEHLFDDGGNLVGASIYVDGDDIKVTLGFSNWTSGTQYAVGRARIELDILA